LSDYPEIVIIVGSGRSGTSYLQRTLRDTFDIGFFREPKYIIPIYRQLFRFGDLRVEKNLQRLVRQILRDEIFERLSTIKNIPSIFDELYPRVTEPTYSGILYAIFEYVAEKQNKHRLGYKFPSDIINIPDLANIFPTARFVHMLRDGRDVAISLLRQHWGAVNLYAGSKYWANRTSQGRKAGISLSGRYIEVRFEDLVLHTEDTASTLGEFLIQKKNVEQVNDLIRQINTTKKKSAVYGWKTKLTKDQVFMCESAANSELKACGYPLEYNGMAKISPFKAWYYLSSDLFSRIARKGKRKSG